VGGAEGARRRARATREEVERRERKTTARVDERLDALLGAPREPSRPTFRISVEEDEDDGLLDIPAADDAQTRTDSRAQAADRPTLSIKAISRAEAPGQHEVFEEEPTAKRDPSARKPFDSARATPIATDLLPDLEKLELEPQMVAADSTSVEQLDDGDEDTREHDVRTFRERFQNVFKSPSKLPESIDENSALGRLILRARSEAEEDDRAELDAELASRQDTDVDAGWDMVFDQVNEHTEITEAAEDELDVSEMMTNIDRARGVGDPEDLAQAIEELLALAEASRQDAPLPDDQQTALSRELGELLYYELERPNEAKPFLERVRRDDPEGLGAEGSVVNALEEIYQDHGQVDQQLDLLRQRLARAQSADMAATYRLLIAKLLWDSSEDREGARGELAPLLKEDPEHDAANRLLGQIAQEAGDWGEAAMRIELVLRQRAGGLDEVEMERDLADIYLNHLEQPEAAIRRYENVLSESPADAQALEGIKQAQAALQDWAGYIGSLGRELGMLLGRPEGVSLTTPGAVDPEAVASPLRTAASQIISDAAHISEVELGDSPQGRTLWRLAFDLWPEHVEALERSIAIDRAAEDTSALAEDLEAYADLLLDAGDRFDTLLEAAKLHLDALGDADRARELLAEAIASVQDMSEPPEGLDEARRLMQASDA